MNERIFTELYKKVWGHFPCPTGEPELEKFAELIVRECVNIVEDAVLHREPASTYVGKLKQHFGVKE